MTGISQKIAERREQMRVERLRAEKETMLAKNEGRFWAAYGALIFDSSTGRSRAVVELRQSDWPDMDQEVFDAQYGGIANAMFGPMEIVGDRGYAAARVANALAVDELTLRFS